MEDTTYYRRQGFWLRMARERAGKSQKGAALELGMSEKSKSTISDYERGEQVAPQPVLRRLARWYGVPVELFLNPRATADEVIEDRMHDLARRAAAVERLDWEWEGEAPVQASDDESGGGPHTRPA